MKSIKWYMAGLIVLSCFLLAGCEKKQPDTYIEGSDYQYMQREAFFSFCQQGDGVQYFAYNHYLYYLDESGNTLLPLCSKADCLHDRETDTERIQDCNAYIETEAVDTGIAYCNGYVYYVNKGGGFSSPALYRVSADGAKKEQLYQWEEDVSILQWIVHRDVLYYGEHSYFTSEEGTEERYVMKALSLTGKGIKKPNTIYTADENLDVFSLANPEAYGNFLYFQIIAQKKTEDEVTDDNYIDYMYKKTFIYNMENAQLSELTLPDMEKVDTIQGVVFWQDRILFHPNENDKEYMEPTTWYIADLDGSDAEVFMENIGRGLKFFSDGKYLYLSNAVMVELGFDKNEIYKVYDKELTLVDTFTLPFEHSFSDPAIGNQECMYIIYEHDEDENEEENNEENEEEEIAEWGVARWDKSKLGSYDGSAFEMTEIKYEG